MLRLAVLAALLLFPPAALADDDAGAVAPSEDGSSADGSSADASPEAPPSEDAPSDDGPSVAPAPSLDLTLHRDPTTASDQEVWWGAVRVTAKLDTTKIFLDGEFIGEGAALKDRVQPGVHTLEATLASGRRLVSSVLVRPGALVEYEVHMGTKQGEKAYTTLLNVAAIALSTAVSTINAVNGDQPIQSDVPGLITPGDAMKSGNRRTPRP